MQSSIVCAHGPLAVPRPFDRRRERGTASVKVLRLCVFCLEREAVVTQKRTTLVIRRGRGHDSDVETADAVDLVLIDLVEHALLLETEGVVAVPIELLGRQAAEVADTRQCERDQAVDELPRA